MIPGDPCIGPNHGKPNALPTGNRYWVAGHCLSLTQEVPERGWASQMIFCGSDCLCDWHGGLAATEQNFIAKGGDFEIEGHFTLVWITPAATSIGKYERFSDLTEKIAEFQMQMIDMLMPEDSEPPETLR